LSCKQFQARVLHISEGVCDHIYIVLYLNIFVHELHVPLTTQFVQF